MILVQMRMKKGARMRRGMAPKVTSKMKFSIGISEALDSQTTHALNTKDKRSTVDTES